MKKLSTLLISNLTTFFLFIIAIGLTSCDDDGDDTDAPTQPATTPQTIEFGNDYQILDGSTLSQGALPILAGDSVFIRVAYSGCTANHEFEFNTRTLGEKRAEIWLEKVTGDELCSAFFTNDQVHRVPFSVLEKEEIFLVGPDFYNLKLR